MLLLYLIKLITFSILFSDKEFLERFKIVTELLFSKALHNKANPSSETFDFLSLISFTLQDLMDKSSEIHLHPSSPISIKFLKINNKKFN